MTKVYKGEFASWDDVRSNFSLSGHEAEPDDIFAVYDTPPYEGYATIVFRRDGQWFEASGSHCSCYGLEGQWNPKKIDPAVHLKALSRGKRSIFMAAFSEDFDNWLKEEMNPSETAHEA